MRRDEEHGANATGVRSSANTACALPARGRWPGHRLLWTATLLLLVWPARAGGQSGPSSISDFEHVPLLYQGPDPTSDSYWPPDGPGLGPPLAAPGSLPGWEAASQIALPDPHAAQLAPWEPVPPLPPPYEPVGEPCGVLSEHKEGFFQKASFTFTWIDRGDVDSYGVSELDLYGVFALPAPNREWPLLITPAFGVRLMDGPSHPDLPPQLYEAYVDFMWLPRLSERWLGILAIAPSYYGDFEVDDSEAWRFTGKGLARFDWIPDRLQLAFGVLYLNRRDVRVLPAGGLIWTPRDDRRYELLFPQPKLAHRIQCGPSFEDWLYLGAEFGGNSYAYLNGTLPDIVTLRDYRIYLGLERKLNGGAGFRLEIGYAFSRSAEFASGLPDVNADDTAHLRWGMTY